MEIFILLSNYYSLSFSRFLQKFTFLTKGELFTLNRPNDSKKKSNDSPESKKKTNWVIDEHKYLNLSQVKKLRGHCRMARERALEERKYVPIRDWFMVELGLSCGLRVSEMVNLKVSNLSIQSEESSLIVKEGKGGKTRIIHFGHEFKEVCALFLKYKEDSLLSSCSAYIFTGTKGSQLTKRALQKAFKRCLKGAGLDEKYGIHCLRHTYGTHLYKASGYNLRLVQQQLGHASIKTTQVYADLFDEDMKIAVERLYK